MSSITRRRMLQAFSAIASAQAMGCASEDEEEVGDEGADALQVCIGRMDRGVRELNGPAAFHKYEKFVVLMMENRSFDHYFGHLTIPREFGGEGLGKWDGRTPDPQGKLIDGLLGTETNPDLNGNKVKIFRPNHYAIGDIDHEWDSCHGQFSNGTNQGFVLRHQQDLERLNDNLESTKAWCYGYKGADGKARCGDPADPMAYYIRRDTPIFHSLFDNYAICDRYFSSVMGPTWPNRFYMSGATAAGRKANSPIFGGAANSIWGKLRDKCLSSRVYFQDIPWIDGAYPGAVVGRTVNTARIFNNQPAGTGALGTIIPNLIYNTFEDDCREGTLPTYSMIDPGFIAVPNDDHPPRDVQAGQTLVAAIYKMLTLNEEQWKKTLFLITYDEHGSFYDHVAPGICREETNPEFKQLGFRVPMIVVGPYVKKNFVSHVQYDHSSVLSTLTKRFKLDAINDRVRAAADLSDCIDRNALERVAAPAPAILPKTRVSEFDAHETNYESDGQAELAMQLIGKPVDRETKKIYTDKFLEAADRLGVAEIY
jgi:phospholipase C